MKKSRKPLQELVDKLRAKRDEIDNHQAMLRADHVRASLKVSANLLDWIRTLLEASTTAIL